MDNVLFQFFVFVYSLYGGILIGILLDIHKVLTMKKFKGKTFFIDIFFLAIAAYIFFKILYLCTYGEWRLYIIFGILAGLAGYRKIFSQAIVSVLYKFKQKINVYMPIKFVGNILYNPIYVLHLKLKYAIIKLQKLMSTLFTNGKGEKDSIRKEVIKCPKEKNTGKFSLKRWLVQKRKRKKRARHL